MHHYFPSFHHPLISDEDNIPDNDSYKCSVLKSNRSILVLSGKFEGIPDNLTINVVTWIVSESSLLKLLLRKPILKLTYLFSFIRYCW